MKEYPQFALTLPAGHPVKVYFDENILITELLEEVLNINIEKDFEKFFNIFNELSGVEKKFARKENQLFPYLEKYNWTGPSQGMWAFHDSIRDIFRDVRSRIENKELGSIPGLLTIISEELHRLFQVEQMRLFPYALELLSEDDWKAMKIGDEEIGWMLREKPTPYPTQEEYIHPSKDTKKRKLTFDITDSIKLDEGYLAPDQINMLLKFMPVDITYVDENDKVLFYNRGEERVFPRSAGIIGREVRFCHPPKSVDQVLRILEEFRAGTKSEAEFWINFKGKMIHIRYFALRDDADNYKGVIEMSQDITDIQKLSGEQRLLDWD
jgi:PAS domain S-box-containing protein